MTSHGNYDEEAVEMALQSDSGYVALVASEKRSDEVLEYLRGSGLSEESLARLRSPAGLDLGGYTPEEIALSVLAEIIQFRRQGRPTLEPEILEEFAEALDPVCGMTVDIATSTIKSFHEGQTYHFCSVGCKHRFEEQPETYLVKG